MPTSQIQASAMCVVPIFRKVKNRDVRVGWIPAVNTCVWKFIKIQPVETWQRLTSWWKDGREDSAVTLRGAVMSVVQRRHICYPLLSCCHVISLLLLEIFKYMEWTALTVCGCFLLITSAIIFHNPFSKQDKNLEVGTGNTYVLWRSVGACEVTWSWELCWQ
jgi:hypothetical protein